MGGIVFGEPFEPPAPPVSWTGLDMTWTGWEGSVWQLSSPVDGTVMMPGVRGLTMPAVVHYTSTHASVPGARWRGHTVAAREVFWPLQVYTDAGSTEWLDKDQKFWRTMRPDKTGVWTVKRPDGQTRTLTLRFVDDGTHAYNIDPAICGWTSYGVTLTAEQPYWAGPTETGSWAGGSAPQFFPTLTIAPGGTLATAQLNNPGDVEVWPVWRIYGPCTNATVGLNGRTITIPFTLNDGEMLEIDTAPRAQTAMMGAVDRTGELTGVDFAPLPADQRTTLALSIAGGGRITATLTPLYLRAW